MIVGLQHSPISNFSLEFGHKWVYPYKENSRKGALYMVKKIHFEFDAERQVLIKYSYEDSPKIIEKNNLIWRDLGPQDEPYARAIYLGQGCWERLDTVTEEDAKRILTQWGYLHSNK